MTKSLFIATPCHDGRVESAYLCAAINTDRSFRDSKIPLKFYFNIGESMVSRARNNVAKVFLNSVCPETGEPYTHLLMIDSDMGFADWNVSALLNACDAERRIVAGLAPLKRIDWGAVAAAAKQGCPPEQLDWVGSRNALNRLPGFDYEASPDAVVPVAEVGSAFMMIHRSALLEWAAAYPEQRYTPDYTAGCPEFDQAEDRSVVAFFAGMISPDDNRWLSEDYSFCWRARKIGIEVYAHRNVLLEHIGKHTYKPHAGGA